MKKKTIILIYTILISSSLLIGYSSSYFSDTETITNNTFTAGTWETHIADHIVISEIQIESSEDADDEWIELYNPTNQSVNLSEGYRIERASSSGNNPTKFIDFNDDISKNETIPSYGYYLIVDIDANQTLKNMSDAIPTTGRTLTDDDIIYLGTDYISNSTDPDIIDFVGYGNVTDYEGNNSAPNPPPDQSIERKAQNSSTNITMSIGGADENKGNGYDTDNNANDFILRTLPQPQNTSSPKEQPP